MRSRMLLVLAAVLAALALPAVPAFAGGGHGCDATQTTAGGETVEIANGCFGPTTLQVDPGETVTFVNLDAFPHNVSAIGWGHLDGLNEGDSFEAMFDAAGVYPFACQYHPGMVGAIVVGSGAALAGGGAPMVADTGTDAETQVAPGSSATDSGSSSATGWVAGGAIGVAAGLGIGLIARRGARAKRDA